MREREAQRRGRNALPAVSGHYFFFFFKGNSLGASTQTLWMWNPPSRPPQLITSGLFSSLFLYLWLFTAAAEKREGLF